MGGSSAEAGPHRRISGRERRAAVGGPCLPARSADSMIRLRCCIGNSADDRGKRIFQGRPGAERAALRPKEAAARAAPNPHPPAAGGHLAGQLGIARLSAGHARLGVEGGAPPESQGHHPARPLTADPPRIEIVSRIRHAATLWALPPKRNGRNRRPSLYRAKFSLPAELQRNARGDAARPPERRTFRTPSSETHLQATLSTLVESAAYAA